MGLSGSSFSQMSDSEPINLNPDPRLWHTEDISACTFVRFYYYFCPSNLLWGALWQGEEMLVVWVVVVQGGVLILLLILPLLNIKWLHFLVWSHIFTRCTPRPWRDQKRIPAAKHETLKPLMRIIFLFSNFQNDFCTKCEVLLNQQSS